MKRFLTSILLVATTFVTVQAAVYWSTSAPSYSLWTNPDSWSGGAVPNEGDDVCFAWENNIPSGPYYIRLNCSPVIGKFTQPSWRSVPSPTYVGIEEDRLAGYTMTLGAIQRANNTGADLHLDVNAVFSGDVTANIDKGYNASNGIHLNRAVSGPYGITKTGNGSLWLNGENTYTGITTVEGGTLNIGDGSAFAGSFVTPIVNYAAVVVDTAPAKTSVIPGLSGSGSLTKKGLGTLVLAGETQVFSGSAFNIQRHQWKEDNSGTIDCTVPGGGRLDFSSILWEDHFTYLGTEDLDMGTAPVTLKIYQSQNPRVVTVKAKTLTVGGEISGSMGLTKKGRGTMALGGVNAFTGNTTADGGILRLEGAGTAGTGSVSVTANGILVLDNSAATANRIGDSAAVSVGGTLILEGNAAEATAEASGALTLAAGRAEFDIRPASGTAASLAFASLASRAAGNAATYKLPANAAVSFSTLPAVSAYGAFAAIDGTGTENTTGAAVLRGGLVEDASGFGFATLSADGSVRRLNSSTEQTATYADGTDNVRLDLAGDISLSAAAMNTLELCNNSGSAVTVTLSGTLVPQNGILFSGSSPITLTGGAINANTDTANAEAILLSVNTAGVTVDTPITGDNITIGGTGDIALNGNLTAKTYANGYITVNTTGTVAWGQKNTNCGALRLYAGKTQLQSGSRLYEGNSNSSGNRCYLNIAQKATLDLNGVSARVNGITGAGNLTNSVDTAATLTCRFSPSGSNYSDYQPNFNGTMGGNISLAFSSDGYYANKYVQYLECDSTITGTITLSSNLTLAFGSPAAFGNATLVLNSGAKINAATQGGYAEGSPSVVFSTVNPQQWKNFTFNGSVNMTMGAGPVTLSAGIVTNSVNGSTLTIGGDIGETTAGSSFIKAGAGTLVLDGALEYTGTTTVSAGTLVLNGVTGGNRSIEVAEGATLKLGWNAMFTGKTDLSIADGSSVYLQNHVRVPLRSLTINGETIDPSGTYGGEGSGASHVLSCFKGYGMISFLPPPTVVLFK